ncbi:MAG: tetratricopeptide repeat protein, partial [Bacteroidota bacterium]
RPPNQLDVDMAHIIELELKAYLADLNGKTEQANQYFEEGMAIEEGLSYSFGPPDVFKPVHEAYGEYLLAQKDYEKALNVFEKALEVNPRRLRSLRGKRIAAEQLGNQTSLEEAEKELALSLVERERGEIL